MTLSKIQPPNITTTKNKKIKKIKKTNKTSSTNVIDARNNIYCENDLNRLVQMQQLKTEMKTETETFQKSTKKNFRKRIKKNNRKEIPKRSNNNNGSKKLQIKLALT